MRGRKTVWTTEMDKSIEYAYLNLRNPYVYLSKDMSFMNISRQSIRVRAADLGYYRSVKTSYTDKEQNIIQTYSETKTPHQISQILAKNGFKKTKCAIIHYLHYRGLRRQIDTYNVNDLIVGLGCARRKIMRWMESGLLKAYRDPGTQTEWRIRPLNVAQFIKDNAFELETSRPDIPWLVALLLEFGSRI
jgi:hypothetical protein